MGNLWISLESCWCMMGPQRPCPSNFIQTASSISSSAMVGARTVSLEVSFVSFVQHADVPVCWYMQYTSTCAQVYICIQGFDRELN